MKSLKKAPSDVEDRARSWNASRLRQLPLAKTNSDSVGAFSEGSSRLGARDAACGTQVYPHIYATRAVRIDGASSCSILVGSILNQMA